MQPLKIVEDQDFREFAKMHPGFVMPLISFINQKDKALSVVLIGPHCTQESY